MAVRSTRVGDVTVLHLAGAYYGGVETEGLQMAIAEQIAAGNARIVLDLSGCATMNSNALGILIEARRACLARGGDLRLCNAERRVMAVLRVSHLASYFEVHGGRDDAVEAFRSTAA
jgi:anti-anti-sigma factor